MIQAGPTSRHATMVTGIQGGLVLRRTERGGGVYTGFFRTRDFGTVISRTRSDFRAEVKTCLRMKIDDYD
jgi:hypothetical protein